MTEISAVLPKPHIPDTESIKAYRLAQKQTIEGWEIAMDIVILEAQKAAQGNGELDLAWLALTVYNAGKIAGIRMERARKTA